MFYVELLSFLLDVIVKLLNIIHTLNFNFHFTLKIWIQNINITRLLKKSTFECIEKYSNKKKINMCEKKTKEYEGIINI